MPPWAGTLPVLDDFNAGATQLLTARAAWSATEWGSVSAGVSLRTDATPTVANCAASIGNALGNKSALTGTDTFSWATWTVIGTGDTMILGTRCSGTATARTGYVVVFNSGNQFQLQKIVAGAGTAIGPFIGALATAPVTVAMSVVGAHVQAWAKLAASPDNWMNVGDAYDSAITGVGSVLGLGYNPVGALGMSVDSAGGGVIGGEGLLPGQFPTRPSAAF